jgi:alcohol dehydrogenase YqhD (iron-dependent ADH family)
MNYGNFSFHMDTEIVFGRDTEGEVGRLVKKYGGTKAMLVYGSGSIKRSGLYDRVTKSLDAAGIPFAELCGVRANPARSLAEEGVRIAIAEGVDFLLGVGGGSAIDTAKAIACGVVNGGDMWQFFLGKPAEKTLPVGTVVTIAAAGSETSRSCVIVDDMDTGLKKSFWAFRPRFAIMNPELTYTLSPWQTASGCADIFAHTYMRYFSNYPSFLGDRYGESTMQTVVKYAPIAIADPENYEARAEILLASSMSHCDLMMIGRPSQSAGGEHALESQFSGHYNTTHGAGLAVVMPALLKYFVLHGTDRQIARVTQFAEKVFGVRSPKLGIERFSAWLRDLKLPQTLSELGVPNDDLPEAAARCIRARGSIIDGFLTLNEQAVKEIYELAI